MNLRITDRGILQIDDARIIYKNFKGVGSQFNREGDRNFSIIIPSQDIADVLIKEGWNVKVKPPREEGDTPFMTLPVKIKYDQYGRGPSVYLQTGDVRNKLDIGEIGIVDDIDIRSCSMDIRPYDWVMYEGTSRETRGRSAYLQSILVYQEVDRFADYYDAQQ